jgi:hypothetical protein
MNLSQVVWYSLAIGLIVFISLLTISYVSYRVKQGHVKVKAHLNKKQYSKAGVTHNGNMRFIPQKVAYVKKHSDIKETFSYSAREMEEMRRREIEKTGREKKFIPDRTKGRFTVVNSSLTYSEKEFQYIPSQIREDSMSGYPTGNFTMLN